MHISLSTAAAMALLVAATAPVQAATPIGDYFTIGGFGTLGGVATNTDQAHFGHDNQVGGADRHPKIDVDSDLGVQLDGKATSWLSGTVQALSIKRGDQGFTTRVEWAYVLIKPLDGLSIRGGRMATPTFLISDSRNIGYSNNWVRAPNEAYGLAVLSNFDGGDIAYRKSFGPVSFNLNAFTGGNSHFRLYGHDGDGAQMRGLSLDVDTEWATFRASRVNAKVSIPALGNLDDPYSFTGYGASVDRDNIVAQAEYVQRRSANQSAAVDANGWYLMGGYRINNFLPYAIVGHTAPVNSGFPLHVTSTQSTTALGLRWDAFKTADLKFQVDRIDTNGTPGISFTTPQGPPLFPGGPGLSAPVAGKVLVFSVAMDFTF